MHVWWPPHDISTTLVSYPFGIFIWLSFFLPKHVALPLFNIIHVWNPPHDTLLTLVLNPSGIVVWPLSFFPKHTTELSIYLIQLWYHPEHIDEIFEFVFKLLLYYLILYIEYERRG